MPSAPGFKFPDDSIDGIIIWVSIFALVFIISLVIFEILRTRKQWKKLFYTRIILLRSRIPIPKGIFSWIKDVYRLPSSKIASEIGLDAFMYLQYLEMCFTLLISISLVIFAIVVPVNYVASGQQSSLNNLAGAEIILTIANDTLSNFSISKIPHGSNLLIIHTVCAYLVSIIIYRLLYVSYAIYGDHLQWYYTGPCDETEDLRRRTVMFDSLIPGYTTHAELTDWVNKLGLGEVESINMNTPADSELNNAIDMYNKTLCKLEKAYMDWAVNLFKEVRGQNILNLFRTTSQQRMMIIEQRMSLDSRAKLTKEVVQKCRPIMDSGKDAIDFLVADLKKREIEVNIRRKPTENTLSARQSSTENNPTELKFDTFRGYYHGRKEHATSAFVTFADCRSADYALQLLLHAGTDGYSMRVKDSPSPNEIRWENVSKPHIDKFIIRNIISGISFVLSVVWVLPTYYLAGIPSQGISNFEKSPFITLIVTRVVPPVIVLSFAALMSVVLLLMTNYQRLTSLNEEQAAYFGKYFNFLLFNVQFVFALVNSAFGQSTTFFQDPLLWIQNVAISFPTGAPFFISYIILCLSLFPVELLRPDALLYSAFFRIFAYTPRDFSKLHSNSSKLNYGLIFPFHVIVLVVCLSYSIISPLILVPGTIYFGVAWIVYKNQLAYVYIKQSESNGKIWLSAYNRTIFGVYLFQFITSGILSAKGAPYAAFFCGILLPITHLFNRYLKACFGKLDIAPALESLEKPRTILPSRRDFYDNESDHQYLTSPLSPHETLLTKYQPPGYCKPLDEPQLPLYIYHLLNEEQFTFNESSKSLRQFNTQKGRSNSPKINH